MKQFNPKLLASELSELSKDYVRIRARISNLGHFGQSTAQLIREHIQRSYRVVDLTKNSCEDITSKLRTTERDLDKEKEEYSKAVGLLEESASTSSETKDRSERAMSFASDELNKAERWFQSSEIQVSNAKQALAQSRNHVTVCKRRLEQADRNLQRCRSDPKRNSNAAVNDYNRAAQQYNFAIDDLREKEFLLEQALHELEMAKNRLSICNEAFELACDCVALAEQGKEIVQLGQVELESSKVALDRSFYLTDCVNDISIENEEVVLALILNKSTLSEYEGEIIRYSNRCFRYSSSASEYGNSVASVLNLTSEKLHVFES